MKTRALIHMFALAALVAVVYIARAEDETKPAKPAKPEGDTVKIKPDNGDVKIITKDGDFSHLTIKPLGPATQPVEEVIKPNISADAQKLIDEVVEAYTKLKSLELAGTVTGEIEAAGQHTGGTIPFTAAFKSPNQFRHDAKDDILIGSTGEKAYAYVGQDHAYLQSEAPKEKVATKDLPNGIPEVLEDQDPSLRLAVAKDPAHELLDHVTDVIKGGDARIGDATCPTLKLTLKDKSTALVAIDPATHLIRRAIVDVRAQLETKKVPEIKQALYTIDYTTIKADAAVKADQFAWLPPVGAKDIKNAKDPGSSEEPEAAMELIGKDVPDFSLPGMDGKIVSKASLKGQVYILDFWATWCGLCKQSLPHLDKLYQAEKAAGLKVFAVNLGEEKEKVEEFVTTTKLSLPILLDTEGKYTEPFKANGIPETVVVGKNGKVVTVFVGFDATSTPGALKKVVEAELKK